MQKIKTVFLTILLIGLPASQVFADDTASSTVTGLAPASSTTTPTAVSSSTQPSVLGVQAPQVPPLIASIKQAKAQLASVTLNYSLSPTYKTVTTGTKKKKTSKQVLSGYSLGDKDIALAILDPATNTITITIGKQNGSSMTFSNGTVILTRFNGVNSRFSVNNPANGIVVAEKYLISPVESGSKASIENALSEAVYVPYSSALNDPQVVKYGEDYLTGVIKKAAADLAAIPSQAIPGMSIPLAIPPARIKALVYAEHTDTTQVLTGNIQETLNQLNILLASNEGDTYKYSVSTASARGIAQFIPSTYQSLVARHPEAKLIPNFVTAMADHENSIEAMYLLLDDYAGAVRVKGQLGFTQGQVFDYGAAAYNGGTSRVSKAVNTYGLQWNQDRSEETNALQVQVNSLQSQVSSLTVKIKKIKDKKTRADLQTQLTNLSNQLASANDNLTTLQSATLKSETINYLHKINKVVQVFSDQQI